MSDVTISDLYKYANDKKPIEFELAFDDLIKSKISNLIDIEKEKITVSLFDKETNQENNSEEEPTEEE